MSGKPPQKVFDSAALRERAAHYREMAAHLGPGQDADTLRGFARDYVERAETMESIASADRAANGER